jgi:hypothetical protein
MDFGFITLIISVIKRHRVVRINRPLGIKLKTSRRKSGNGVSVSFIGREGENP